MVRRVDTGRWVPETPTPERDRFRRPRAETTPERADIVSISREARASAERMAHIRARIESGYYLREDVQRVVAERLENALLD